MIKAESGSARWLSDVSPAGNVHERIHTAAGLAYDRPAAVGESSPRLRIDPGRVSECVTGQGDTVGRHRSAGETVGAVTARRTTEHDAVVGVVRLRKGCGTAGLVDGTGGRGVASSIDMIRSDGSTRADLQPGP